jgi:hypothetical protein
VYNTNKLIATVKKNNGGGNNNLNSNNNKKGSENNINSLLSMDPYEPWNKLIKIANLKGKYKYREKFNYTYSAQLKALNFKRK